MKTATNLITVFMIFFGMAAIAQADNTPSGVTIREVNYAGSGCAAGTIAGRMHQDFTAFSLYMDDFVAETGPGVSIREKRKNCTLSIDLVIPSGWSYAVASVEYRGFVDIDRGVKATQSSSYYFQGQTGSVKLTSSVNGPMASVYKIKDTLGIESVVWSPCGAGRALNVSAQVLLSSSDRNAYGLISLDRITGKIEHSYGLIWKRCS